MTKMDADLSLEPVVGTLRVRGGTSAEDVASCAVSWAAPSDAARGRKGEHLFVLLDLGDSIASHPYRELQEVVARTYWATDGSITAALRQAAAAANRYLFRRNLQSDPSERCYGGLTCVVLHGDDIFLLQAGPAWACVFQEGRLTCFPRDETLTHMGIGPVADVRLYHVFASVGDTLLLASPALIQQAGGEGLARALSSTEMREALAKLERLGADADFTALVAQLRPSEEASAAREMKPAVQERSAASVEPREPAEVAPKVIGEAVEEPAPPPPRPTPKRRRPDRKPGPTLVERLRGVVPYLGRGLGYVWQGIRAVGAGLFATGKWVVGLLGTLFQRMLPGPRREARQRVRRQRPVPEENRTLMMAISIGILVLVAIITTVAYLYFGAQSRLQGLIGQAEQQVAQAQAVEEMSEEARSHWEAALELASAAVTLQPDHPDAVALRDQAQLALDRFDRVGRLTPIELVDFGSENPQRRLVIHGQMLFVLDPTGGWVARISLNAAGDDMVEEEVPILAQTGQRVEGDDVGNLVDCVWVERAGERQTSALLILEEGGALLSYDPAWEQESGAQVSRSFLGTQPAEPRAVGSYHGRFYVLDAAADANGQIWRYVPQGDAYSRAPERYFTEPPDKPLSEALDMVIDGHIYVLHTDGVITKYLGGQAESFDVRDVPDGMGQVTALALDQSREESAVYVADRGNERVVMLAPDGAFQAQFRAGDAFDALEALAVDGTANRLYVLSGGRLYVATLP